MKKEIFKKSNMDDEAARTSLNNQLQEIYSKLEALSEEKLAVVEKLFSVQENFIRKLD